MNTYSIVYTYREYGTDKLTRFSIKGNTYSSCEAAYEVIMQGRRNYKPGDKRQRWCVWENYFPIDLAYEAMGIPQRAAYDEAVQNGAG